MDALLGKIQQLNSIFSKSATTLTPLSALCDQLCNIIGCNIYVFSREGRIFAYSIADAFECPYTKCSLKEEQLPPYYYEIFLSKISPFSLLWNNFTRTCIGYLFKNIDKFH